MVRGFCDSRRETFIFEKPLQGNDFLDCCEGSRVSRAYMLVQSGATPGAEGWVVCGAVVTNGK